MGYFFQFGHCISIFIYSGHDKLYCVKILRMILSKNLQKDKKFIGVIHNDCSHYIYNLCSFVYFFWSIPI